MSAKLVTIELVGAGQYDGRRIELPALPTAWREPRPPELPAFDAAETLPLAATLREYVFVPLVHAGHLRRTDDGAYLYGLDER